MRLVRSVLLRRGAGLAAAAGLSVLGVAGLPEAAPAATLAGPPAVDRFNVGSPHSPQLLRALAGPTSLAHPAGSAGAGSPAVAPQVAAASGTVRGVDIASYQHVNGGAIGWSKVAAAGYKFVAIKVSEGNYYANPYRASDLSGAEAAKLSVIAYHFAIPNVSGGASQADYAIAHAADKSGKVAPIGLDIEYDPYSATDGTNECYGFSRASMTSWVAAFSNEVSRRTGRLPVLYSTADWWNTCADSKTMSQDPLWVAAYTTAASPPLPVGWSTYAIWQYTSAGTVPGIATTRSTDMDEFNSRAIPVFNPGNQTATATMAAKSVTAAMMAVSGSAAPAYTATGLPPGLTLGATTGKISGTPTTPGTYQVKVTAKSGALTGLASFSWTVLTLRPTNTYGSVHLDLGGKCLTDAGDSSAAGAKIETWPCNGRSYEHWLAQDGLIKIHSKCMAVAGAGTANESKVVLAACTSAASQEWRAGTNGDLVNLGSGKCLDDPGSSTANGVALWIWTCSGEANQKWTLPPGPVLSQVAGKCLDNKNGSSANGNKVEIWSCNGAGAQKWTVEPGGTVQTAGKCLDVYHGDTAAGSVVDLFTCNGTAAQQWRVLGDGLAGKLQNPKSGECVTDPKNATVNGTGLVLGACSATGAGTAWLIR